MNATQILLAVVKTLEWSGSRQGPGSGPMFSGDDGKHYAACPACGQLMREEADFTIEAAGHKKDCPLSNLIKKLTKVLA